MPIMGVPSLYKWLTQKYPSIKHNMSQNSDYHVDCLYLDFNAIIHPCTDKTLSNLADVDSKLYESLQKYVDNLISLVKPRKMIYISVDGVAPRAKLNQQRGRRFEGGKEVVETGEIYLNDGVSFNENLKYKFIFDSNSITPGTSFMDRLDTFITEFIKFKISTDYSWKNLSVIYSNYKVPGEGEQKIMEYIRIHQKNRDSHVLFSPDADLIFLGLTLVNNNVRIMREEAKRFNSNQEDPPTFALLDIRKLRNCLLDQFKYEIDFSFDSLRLLEDFVFLCFTVGNDFLPSAPCFEIRTNALEKISILYLKVFKRTRSYITNNGSVNYDILKEFFKECSLVEDVSLREKRKNLVDSRLRMDLAFSEEEEFFLFTEKGKVRYYIEKMNIKSEDELLIACTEYIKGMEWIYKYYFYSCPSWDYFYPYYFAPFMSDLSAVSKVSVEFPKSRPLRPMEQLLAVVPSVSNHLLPIPFRKYFYENEFVKCKIDDHNDMSHFKFDEHRSIYDNYDFLDLKFEIDNFQKVMDWQAIPILPFVNPKKIQEFTKENQHLLTFEEAGRNSIGLVKLFTNIPNVVKMVSDLYKKQFDVLNIDHYSGKVFSGINIDLPGQEIKRNGFNYINNCSVVEFNQRYRIYPKNYKK